MPGMTNAEEMEPLDCATGAEFARMFLTAMIEHHNSAIGMAKTEQAEGMYTEAIAMAEQIESAQAEEVATMQERLH